LIEVHPVIRKRESCNSCGKRLYRCELDQAGPEVKRLHILSIGRGGAYANAVVVCDDCAEVMRAKLAESLGVREPSPVVVESPKKRKRKAA
jgi:hypothetical protein